MWPYKKVIKLNILFFLVFFIIFYYGVVRQKPAIGFSDSHPDIEELLKETEKRNTNRIRHVRNVCDKLYMKYHENSNEQDQQYKEPLAHYEVFYYDRRNKLSWCPIYKAGSTTWLSHFVTLAGFSDADVDRSKIQISRFVRNNFPALEAREAIEFLPNSLKLLIVRHPFERILSAYRDKLENIATRTETGSPHYYLQFGRKIVAKYRVGGNATNSRTFLKPGQYLWSANEIPPLGIEPTFSEFVRYLHDTDLSLRADDHWIPYYLYCTPCSIHFDVIGKTETMFTDQLLVVQKSGLNKILKPKWKHKTNPFANQHQNKMSDIARIYFSQLNSTDVIRLYEKYKWDFQLFQYNPKEYVKFASQLKV